MVASNKSRTATLAALRRLQEKGELSCPYRGFFLIIPPTYEIVGCLPAEQFIPDLMQYLNSSYYAGLLTAAAYHGAAHQKPQEFQVITEKYRPALRCGKITCVFIVNKKIANVPTQQVNTATGYLTISTPEATAIDLMQYPRRSGGINNIVTVLNELAESIQATNLQTCIEMMTPEIVFLQRLGYCFDLIDRHNLSSVVREAIKNQSLRTRPLVAGISTKHAKRNKKWELFINFEVEPDL